MSIRRFDAQAEGFVDSFGQFLALRRAQGFEGAALDAPPPPGTGSARDRLYTRLAQGVSDAGAFMETSRSIATNNRALSASDEKNCAAMMV